MRNIALFIDGTWNDRERTRPTNVWQLYQSAVHDSADQITDYVNGVGTEIGGNWIVDGLAKRARLDRGLRRLPRLLRNALGGAFGWGTTYNIKRAYAFLCENYQGTRGNIYLFGFSRGAFAVRSLAGFVDIVGLLLADKLEYVEEAYALYVTQRPDRPKELDRFLYEVAGVTGPFPEGSPNALPIYFIGVWDTVRALGVPRFRRHALPFGTAYHRVELPSNVKHAFHALSLHELRRKFEPLLWTEWNRQKQSVKQVWFSGDHSNTGGGHDEQELSNIALNWMAGQAQQLGLRLEKSYWTPADPLGPGKINHQFRRWFLFMFPRVRRTLTDPGIGNSLPLHVSVRLRLLDSCSRCYSFRHPCVNPRLRTIDRVATMQRLRLHAAPGWWQRVSENEVLSATENVAEFLSAEGRAADSEAAQFRCSVAILIAFLGQCVLDGISAVVEARHRRYELLLVGSRDEFASYETRWLLRLKQIEAALPNGEELSSTWTEATETLREKLQCWIKASDLKIIERVIHDGVGPFPALPTIKVPKRNVHP